MIKDEETKAFFELLMSNETSTDYTDELKIYVADAKQRTENKRQFMEWERQRAYDFEDGMQQKAIEAATNLLKMKLGTPEQIAQAQGLPLEQVLELQKSISVETNA